MFRIIFGNQLICLKIFNESNTQIERVQNCLVHPQIRKTVFHHVFQERLN